MNKKVVKGGVLATTAAVTAIYVLSLVILNVQSYPTVGGNWTVDFTTTGRGTLYISPLTYDDYNTRWGEDIELLQVLYNGRERTPSKVLGDGTLVFYNWGYRGYTRQNAITVKVLKPGKHHLRFKFGTKRRGYIVKDAYNNAYANMTAYWDMNEGTGSTAEDTINGNNGTLVGGASWATGKVGYGVKLDGADGGINVSYDPSLDIIDNDDPFAVAVWVKMDKLASDRGVDNTILSQQSGTGTGVVWLQVESNGDYLKTTLGGVLLSGNILIDSTTKWYFIALTYNGTHLDMYINGTYDVTRIGTLDQGATGDYNIGRTKGESKWFNGTIDDLRFFNRNLSAAEIQELYEEKTITGCTVISTQGEYTLNKSIEHNDATACINITASNVVFDGQGYTIDGNDTAGTYGIYSRDAINVTVKNTSISDWGYGIGFKAVNDSYVLDNNISDNNYGIYFSSSSSNNTISNNTISNNTDRGVFLWNSYENNITSNTANFNTLEGIYLYSSDRNNLTNNNASNNGRWGVYLYRSHYNTISSNTANSNTQHGLYVDESDNNTANNNSLISNSQRGLYLAYALSNIISENILTNNTDHGVVIRLSEDNTIYNNYFNNTANFEFLSTIYDNSWNVTKTPGTNIIGGPYLGGNFWAYPNGTGFSETCTNADGDGICDSSYNLTSGNVDYLSLTGVTTTTNTPNTTIYVYDGTGYNENDIVYDLWCNYHESACQPDNQDASHPLIKIENNGTAPGGGVKCKINETVSGIVPRIGNTSTWSQSSALTTSWANVSTGVIQPGTNVSLWLWEDWAVPYTLDISEYDCEIY